jgi:hypothetical protein
VFRAHRYAMDEIHVITDCIIPGLIMFMFLPDSRSCKQSNKLVLVGILRAAGIFQTSTILLGGAAAVFVGLFLLTGRSYDRYYDQSEEISKLNKGPDYYLALSQIPKNTLYDKRKFRRYTSLCPFGPPRSTFLLIFDFEVRQRLSHPMVFSVAAHGKAKDKDSVPNGTITQSAHTTIHLLRVRGKRMKLERSNYP